MQRGNQPTLYRFTGRQECFQKRSKRLSVGGNEPSSRKDWKALMVRCRSDVRPLPLSHTSHAPPSLFCQPVPLTPSVSPRRSHRSLSPSSLVLSFSPTPPSPPPPSVTLTPFVRSYLWQRWWCHRRVGCWRGGLAGVQSAVSSVCVCMSGQCGNAREKKVTDAAESSLRVCVSDGEDTRDVGASLACSPEPNHRGNNF